LHRFADLSRVGVMTRLRLTSALVSVIVLGSGLAAGCVVDVAVYGARDPGSLDTADGASADTASPDTGPSVDADAGSTDTGSAPSVDGAEASN
jgi:hypothetical protein